MCILCSDTDVEKSLFVHLSTSLLTYTYRPPYQPTYQNFSQRLLHVALPRMHILVLFLMNIMFGVV